MGTILEPIVWMMAQLVYLYILVVGAQIVLHWLIHFNIIGTDNMYVAKAMELLNKITQPAYDKVREKVPAVSGFDFSPFVLLLLSMFVWRVLYRFDLALM